MSLGCKYLEEHKKPCITQRRKHRASNAHFMKCLRSGVALYSLRVFNEGFKSGQVGNPVLLSLALKHAAYEEQKPKLQIKTSALSNCFWGRRTQVMQRIFKASEDFVGSTIINHLGCGGLKEIRKK